MKNKNGRLRTTGVSHNKNSSTYHLKQVNHSLKMMWIETIPNENNKPKTTNKIDEEGKSDSVDSYPMQFSEANTS